MFHILDVTSGSFHGMSYVSIDGARSRVFFDQIADWEILDDDGDCIEYGLGDSFVVRT